MQNYTINQSKVIFLKQKTQSKSGKPGCSDTCHSCGRSVKEGCTHCSLACKVRWFTILHDHICSLATRMAVD